MYVTTNFVMMMWRVGVRTSKIILEKLRLLNSTFEKLFKNFFWRRKLQSDFVLGEISIIGMIVFEILLIILVIERPPIVFFSHRYCFLFIHFFPIRIWFILLIMTHLENCSDNPGISPSSKQIQVLEKIVVKFWVYSFSFFVTGESVFVTWKKIMKKWQFSFS